MIGGKAQGVTRPSALGTMLNAATYGRVKYSVIGTTRASLLAIWAANLRQGDSNKKSKKGKGPPTYIENVDFFCGTNPIEGPLQVWSNNTNRYTLDFIKLDINSPVSGSGLFPWMNHMSVVDSHFYFVLAVTVDIENYGSFSDYGDPRLPGGILQYDISGVMPGGSGYAIGDQFSISGGGGNGDAVGHVTAVSGGGVVTAYVLDNPGSGYHATSFNTPTTTLTGSGTGLEINIWLVGKQVYGANNTSSAPVVIEITEHPMWNLAQHGPNIVQPSMIPRYPYVYYWTPACGSDVYFPSYNNIPSFGVKYHIYYARLNNSTRHRTPIAFNRMHFEPILAGPAATEYALAARSFQQDPHPCDAGLGSPNIDLGYTGLLPDWRVELKGSHALHAPVNHLTGNGCGDADFVDMIQDTFISGQLQVGSQLGLLQRGVNCNDLPGLVQQYFDGTLEPVPTQHLTYAQPNAAGSIILTFMRWRYSGGTNPSGLADTAGDAWTTVFANPNSIFAYATSVGSPLGNVVQASFNGGSFAYDSRGYIFEMDPGSNQIIDSDVSQGTGATVGQVVSVSVTVDRPCYLLVAAEIDNYVLSSIPPHWDYLNSPMDAPTGVQNVILMKRYVSAPGTYTFSVELQTSIWNLGIVAMGGDPSPLPKALGDIIDHPSLELTRTQCWANGLWGSICMDSQRPASDWIDEFLTCADAAAVWSGFKLKVIPRSEVSFAGNGVVYISPTAAGPVATITINDIVDRQKSPVKINRSAQVDAPGISQIEYVDRGNDYNYGTASEPEPGSNVMFGPRKRPVITLHEIQDPAVARKINIIEVHRRVYLRNSYQFTLNAKWIFLEAMDLIRIPDPNDFSVYIDVRLTKVAENDQFDLECEADPFIYGLNAPNELEITAVVPDNANSSVVPALVNTPVIFEPVPPLYQNQNMRQLAFVVSDSDIAYGGCFVYVSTDGGLSYKILKGAGGETEILGNGVTGVTTALWPAATSPDNTNDLPLDLTESLGVLASYTVADEDNFVFPCYVAGGTGSIPYELMTYAVAQLTGTNLYTLKAVGGGGNHLDRAVFGAPNPGGVGVSHALGSRFAFIDPSGIGNMFVVMPDIWIGQTLYFKFPAFNTLGGGLQDLADCVAYPFTPTGLVGSVNPGGVPPVIVAVN